MIRKVNPLWKT